MALKRAWSICLLVSALRVLSAQAPPATPKALPAEIAGIPVNYDESKVGTYSLPDPLKLNNGKPVHDAMLIESRSTVFHGWARRCSGRGRMISASRR
jgi:hypothetical protein